MSEKSTDAEVEQRVNKVYELLVNSWNRYNILQYSRENWDIGEKQADNYIAMAKVIIKENAKQSQEEYYEESKNKFDDMYKKAMSLKDVRLCKDIELARNKVLGYEKISFTGEIKHDLTNDTLDKIFKGMNEI